MEGRGRSQLRPRGSKWFPGRLLVTWSQTPIILKRNWIRIRIRIEVKSWIRFRIKVKTFIRISMEVKS
jgi:hypothetical protein